MNEQEFRKGPPPQVNPLTIATNRADYFEKIYMSELKAHEFSKHVLLGIIDDLINAGRVSQKYRKAVIDGLELIGRPR